MAGHNTCCTIGMTLVIICALSASANVIAGAVSGSVFYLLIASTFAIIGTIAEFILTYYGYNRVKREDGEDNR